MKDLQSKPKVFELHSINCRKSLKVSEQCGNIKPIGGAGVYIKHIGLSLLPEGHILSLFPPEIHFIFLAFHFLLFKNSFLF